LGFKSYRVLWDEFVLWPHGVVVADGIYVGVVLGGCIRDVQNGSFSRNRPNSALSIPLDCSVNVHAFVRHGRRRLLKLSFHFSLITDLQSWDTKGVRSCGPTCYCNVSSLQGRPVNSNREAACFVAKLGGERNSCRNL
jgi:hypothetical protein